MPFATNGVYTPPTGAENAAPGNIIYSSVWNSIFTDLSTALTSVGEQLWGITSVTTSPYSLASTDTFLLVTTTSIAITIDLPVSSSRVPNNLRIKDLTGNAPINNITIVANGSDTIEGNASIVINLAYGGYNLVPVTGGWIISP